MNLSQGVVENVLDFRLIFFFLNNFQMIETGVSFYRPQVQKQPTYRSRLQISLMAWSLAMALFHFGFYLTYLVQIPTETLKQLYNINLQKGLTEGILYGAVPVGGLFGALSSSYLLAKYSRRTNMLIANAFCFIVGSLLYIQSFPMFVICRFCQGMGMGFFTSVAPLIIGQLSPKQIGSIGIFSELNICIGFFFGGFSSYCLSKITGDQTAKEYWFLVFAIPHIVIIIQSILLVFVYPYETPKYLLSVGKQQEARKLLQIIYKPQYVEQILEQKKEDLKKQQMRMSQRASQNNDTTPHKRTVCTISTLLSIHIVVLQQFSGINIVAVYAKKISQQAMSGQFALFFPTLIILVQILATSSTFFLYRCVGRRKAFCFGSIFASIANIFILVGFFIKDSSDKGVPLLLFGMFMFIINFGLTLGPSTWIYINQIQDQDVVPYSITASWISGSIVIILFPILTQDYLKGNPAFLFVFSAVWCSVSIVVNYFFVLETKDKTEKEIRQQFKKLKVCQQ